MTTSAKAAFKTQLQYGDAASPELFTTLSELTTIDPPDQVSKTADVTSHDSTKAEFINIFVDDGEISCEGNFVNDATDTAVLAKLGGAAGNWQICLPNWGARTATFTAAVTDVVTSAGHALTTGQPLRVSTSSALPAGLSANTTYWVRWADVDTFTLHTTNAGAVADTGKVNITDIGTGTHTLQIGNRLSYAGLVKSHKLQPAGLDSRLGLALSMKVTGAVTLT